MWTGQNGPVYATAYTAKVRVSVRAGDITIIREGSGTGEARASTPWQAHELEAGMLSNATGIRPLIRPTPCGDARILKGVR